MCKRYKGEVYLMNFPEENMQTKQQSAGKRLQVIRELIGLRREDFAEAFGLDFVRLRNIEQDKCKVSEFEFEQIGKRMPELLPWLAYAGEISIEQVKENNDTYMRLIAARLEAGSVKPKVMEQLTGKIK